MNEEQTAPLRSKRLRPEALSPKAIAKHLGKVSNMLRSIKPRLTFFLGQLLIAFCATTLAQERLAPHGSAPQTPSHVGLRILRVQEGSAAELAGLQSMDVIAKYGDVSVVDGASYFGARAKYENSAAAKVELVCWHGREQKTVLAPPGRLGFEFNEYGEVAYKLDSLMMELNGSMDCTEALRQGAISRCDLRPRERIVKDAEDLIEHATQKSSLTTTQVLVARIYLIADDAPDDEVVKQASWLQELLSAQPPSYVQYLGFELFFKHTRYRPAIACFKRSLEFDPADGPIRLNLAMSYERLGMFSEADAEAAYLFENHVSLTNYGYAAAFQVKAVAALGRQNYEDAIDYMQKAIDASPTSSYLITSYKMIRAAKTQPKRFAQVLKWCQQLLPQEFEKLNGSAATNSG